MPNIRLKCSDDEFLDVDAEIAKTFTPVATILDDYGVDEEPIPVKVAHGIMQKVVEWAEYHRNDPPTVPPPEPEPKSFGEPKTRVVSSWDQEFLEVDVDTLYDLMMAANYLKVPELLDLICHAVAQIIKGKETKEIREIFNLKNDLDPKEEERLRQEAEWIKETHTEVKLEDLKLKKRYNELKFPHNLRLSETSEK